MEGVEAAVGEEEGEQDQVRQCEKGGLWSCDVVENTLAFWTKDSTWSTLYPLQCKDGGMTILAAKGTMFATFQADAACTDVAIGTCSMWVVVHPSDQLQLFSDQKEHQIVTETFRGCISSVMRQPTYTADHGRIVHHIIARLMYSFLRKVICRDMRLGVAVLLSNAAPCPNASY